MGITTFESKVYWISLGFNCLFDAFCCLILGSSILLSIFVSWCDGILVPPITISPALATQLVSVDLEIYDECDNLALTGARMFLYLSSNPLISWCFSESLLPTGKMFEPLEFLDTLLIDSSCSSVACVCVFLILAMPLIWETAALNFSFLFETINIKLVKYREFVYLWALDYGFGCAALTLTHRIGHLNVRHSQTTSFRL